MGAGDINEVRRKLETELSQKEAILNHFKQNKNDMKEVERIIKNEHISVKRETTNSGNAWENVRVLESNIEKANEEIKLYEKNKSSNRNKFRF